MLPLQLQYLNLQMILNLKNMYGIVAFNIPLNTFIGHSQMSVKILYIAS